MKILHIISQRPDSTGSGIYLQAMLNQASARKHRNCLVAAVNHKTVLDTGLPADTKVCLIQFGHEELDFALPGMSDVMPYPSSRFNDLTEEQLQRYEDIFLAKISVQLQKFKPDIIHSHHLWLLSSLVKRNFSHIPMITSCHGSDLRQFRQCSHLRQRVLKGCSAIDMVLSLSQAQKDEIIDLYNYNDDTVVVSGAGYNSTLFSCKDKAAAPPVHITYCGKMSRAKGVPWLLKALAEVKGVDYHFHLIGGASGPEEHECFKLAHQVSGKVTIHGLLGQHALAALLQKSHIFILPSLYEGLPLVLLEALACGCRLISTDLPGCLTLYNSIDPSLMSLMETPRLHHIDQPFSEDEEKFIADIRSSIETTAALCIAGGNLDKTIIDSNTRQFTWSKVYARVERCYRQLLS